MDKQLLKVENIKPNSRRGYYEYDSPHEFEVTVQPQTSVIFKIKLFGAIEDANQLNSAIEAFERASEDDKVIIHLSSPGGSLDATDTFIHAMRCCEAPVHVIATGGVHSAGTVILLNAPSFNLSENFNCLIHNGSVGPGGKFSDWRAAAMHTDAYMERIMRNTYRGFLSEDEIEQLINGKDFWFDGPEFVRRYEIRNNLLVKEHDEQLVDAVIKDLGVLDEKDMRQEDEPRKKAAPRKKKN